MAGRLPAFSWDELIEKIKKAIESWVNSIAEKWAKLCYGFRKTLDDVKSDLWSWADDVSKYWVSKADEWWSILNWTKDQLEDLWEDAIDRAKNYLEGEINNLWGWVDKNTRDIYAWFELQESKVREWVFGRDIDIEDWFLEKPKTIKEWIFGAEKTAEEWFAEKPKTIKEWIFGKEITADNWIEEQKRRIRTWIFGEHEEAEKKEEEGKPFFATWIETAEDWFVAFIAGIFVKVLDKLLELEEGKK